jgi:hypothetical protein
MATVAINFGYFLWSARQGHLLTPSITEVLDRSGRAYLELKPKARRLASVKPYRTSIFHETK